MKNLEGVDEGAMDLESSSGDNLTIDDLSRDTLSSNQEDDLIQTGLKTLDKLVDNNEIKTFKSELA